MIGSAAKPCEVVTFSLCCCWRPCGAPPAGPAKAISVTFLIPGFAVVWGALFLHEGLTLNMIIGCAVILAGTALATGLVRLFDR